MIITTSAALAYWQHPSQHDNGLLDPELSEYMEYRAEGGVCLAFHPAMIPSVSVCHIGAKPEAWGHLDKSTLNILHAFWTERKPVRIVAWIEEHRRHAIALARRVGFVTDGHLPGIIMLGWRP